VGGVSVNSEPGPAVRERHEYRQWGHMDQRGAGFARTLGLRTLRPFLEPGDQDPVPEPPFGELVAVDLASGDVAWRSVLGRIEALEAIGVREHGHR